MNVTGTINGNAIDAYVRSLSRQQMLCNPMQTATLVLSTAFPSAISEGQDAVLYQDSVKVMTGYVVKTYHEEPSFDWKVEIHDPYTRCQNYFIDSPITVGHDAGDEPIKGYIPQSTDYWLGYLCGLCGAAYVTDGGTGTVPQGVQLGLRTVHEALTDIIAYSSQYVYADPDGVLHFARISRGYANFTLTDCISVEDTLSDEYTRNVIKVYGYASYQSRVFAVASRGVTGIVPDRVSAVGAPMIGTQPEAQRVADYLLSELGSLTHIVTARVVGNPHIRVGYGARILSGATDYTDAVTSAVHSADESGYITEVTIGERCPRIAGWSKETPRIYAGTTAYGVYLSEDGGRNWAEFNSGLPTGNKYVGRLGANSFNEVMGIVNGALYYSDGTNPWEIRTLPAPVNDAEDDPPPAHGDYVAVDALGSQGGFAVLTTNPLSSGSNVQESRSWVYTCASTGSSPADWESVELSNSILSTGSNVSWHTIGMDLRSTLGAPYVLASSGSVYGGPGIRITVGDNTRIWNYRQPDYNYFCGDAPNTGLVSWWVGPIYSLGAGYARITFQAATVSGGFKDNLFMYGSYGGGGAQEALTDENGYRYWGFQLGFRWLDSNVPGHPPYIWEAVKDVHLGFDPDDFLSIQFGQTVSFNLFWSPSRTINFQSITMGEVCGENHAVGTSPYGDMYGPFGQGGPVDPATPYPIASNISAGSIKII